MPLSFVNFFLGSIDPHLIYSDKENTELHEDEFRKPLFFLTENVRLKVLKTYS